MRILMTDFKCYNMKIVLKLVIVTFRFSVWNVSVVIIKVRQNNCFFLSTY